MTTETKTFNSEGGFGVKETVIITDTYDLENVNSFELVNSNFTDAKKSDFILKGLNNTILSKSSTENSFIHLQSNTINFVTANILAVGQNGNGIYSTKIETVVKCLSNGDVSTLSSLVSIIRDDVPSGQSWEITNYDTGNINEFSFSVEANGATTTVKWIAHVQTVSVSW
jgi:hypothetical protein